MSDTTISLKNSTTSGNVPSNALVTGEVAINIQDKKAWVGLASGSAPVLFVDFNAASSLSSGSITSGMIGDNAVLSGNIASGQVGRYHLSNSSVFSGHISSSEVGSVHLASGAAIGNLAPNSITSGYLSNDSVSSTNIVSGSINGDKLTSGAVQSGHIGNNAVNSGNIASGQVGHFHIADNAIQSGNISSGNVGVYKLDALTTTYTANSGLIVGQVLTYTGSGMIWQDPDHQMLIVRNDTGTTITKGSVVYISGGFGNKPLITLASAMTEATSSKTIGILQDDLLNNDEGRCLVSGVLENVNTISYAVGDRLYLSVTAGQWTTTRYQPPVGHQVYIGTVIRSHINLGRIAVTIQNGFEIDELHDVQILSGSKESGQILQYTTQSGGYWQNVMYSVGSGYISNAAIQSGNIASGQISQFHLASGTAIGNLLSGSIKSGGWILGDGVVQSGNIASGVVFRLLSGNITSGFIGNNAVVSGNIASGQVGRYHLSNSSVFSGHISSNEIGSVHLNSGASIGNLLSGSIKSGGWILADGVVQSGNIASGLLSNFTILSGSITSGFIGNNAVVSGNIASGQVGKYHLSNNSVFSGNISSSEVGSVHLASGAAIGNLLSGSIKSGAWILGDGVVQSGNIASGVVFRLLSGNITSGFIGNNAVVSGNIASGQIQTYHIGSATTPTSGYILQLNGTAAQWNAPSSTTILSGAITSGLIGNAAVVSGSIASGQIGSIHLADGAVQSGDISSGQIGQMHLSSGAVNSGHIGNAAVVSGSIASGQVGTYALAATTPTSGNILQINGTLMQWNALPTSIIQSGQITSGLIGDNAVLSGNIGSGQITNNHISSGSLLNTAFRSGQVITSYNSTVSGTTGIVPVFTNYNILGDSNITTSSGRCNVSGNTTINYAHVAVISGTLQYAITVTSGGQAQLGTVSIHDYNKATNLSVGDNTLQFGYSPFFHNNTVIGRTNLYKAGIASGNIIIGNYNAQLSTSPTDNIMIGNGLGDLNNGGKNIIIGTKAGTFYSAGNTNGSGNIIIGYNAGNSALPYSDNIVIGVDSFVPNSTVNSIVIGNFSSGLGSGSLVIGNEKILSGKIFGCHAVNGLSWTSGSITSGGVFTAVLSSGTVPIFGVASGAIFAANMASGSILSGSIASGQIGQFHLSNNSVFSGAIASGQVGNFHLSSGAVTSGDIGNNAVVSGSVASGQIGQFHLSDNSVFSGSIASGQISNFKMSSGSVLSGHIGNNAVVSGSIASGQISNFAIASGAILSGHVGNGAILSGNIASGQIGPSHLNQIIPNNIQPKTNNFRISVQSGVAITSTDQSAQSTLYLVPYTGNQIALYDGTNWKTSVASGAVVSLSITGLTSGLPYDVFAYDNSGVPSLEFGTVWSSVNTRADAIQIIDGVALKSGTTTRRLVGTILPTAPTTTNDTSIQRYVSNYDNQVSRQLFKTDATNHTYASTSPQIWNLSSGNQIQYVASRAGIGANVSVMTASRVSTGAGYARTQIAGGAGQLPSTSLGMATLSLSGAILQYMASPSVTATSILGYNYFYPQESVTTAGATGTFNTMDLFGEMKG